MNDRDWFLPEAMTVEVRRLERQAAAEHPEAFAKMRANHERAVSDRRGSFRGHRRLALAGGLLGIVGILSRYLVSVDYLLLARLVTVACIMLALVGALMAGRSMQSALILHVTYRSGLRALVGAPVSAVVDEVR
jgi:hypothetical protein